MVKKTFSMHLSPHMSVNEIKRIYFAENRLKKYELEKN